MSLPTCAFGFATHPGISKALVGEFIADRITGTQLDDLIGEPVM
ncbi:MAG: hypothetical protein ABI680_03535 [Chthoniobacteraceae bacterium]